MFKKNKEPKTIEELALKYQKNIAIMKLAEFICTGILLVLMFISLLFVLNLQFTSKDTSYKLAAEIVNTYTGIILGFVAMTVSLIGMILSFHNTRQSEQSNLETVTGFYNLQASLSEIAEIERSLSQTLNGLREKMVDIEKLKTIELQLENLSREMRYDFDRNKGSANDRTTTTQTMRLRISEPMKSDEGNTQTEQ